MIEAWIAGIEPSTVRRLSVRPEEKFERGKKAQFLTAHTVVPVLTIVRTYVLPNLYVEYTVLYNMLLYVVGRS